MSGKILIKNGKFFVAPRKTDENFKQLFARLTAVGAGRPADEQGFPDGPWTAEKLADEISSIKPNHKGIELRAVQVWFQDNDNGISDENLWCLSRIFGCGDPEAASHWQAELKVSKERLAAQRRAKRTKQSAADQHVSWHGEVLALIQIARKIIATKSEKLMRRVIDRPSPDKAKVEIAMKRIRSSSDENVPKR